MIADPWVTKGGETTPVDSHDNCPTCGERYTMQCRCRISHRSCNNGHHWHRCPDCRKTLVDDGDHGGGFEAAKCPECRGLVKSLRNPWLTKTRDATGHEHAADGRFGTTAGSHGGKPAPDRHSKPSARPGHTDGSSSKAAKLAAKASAIPRQLRAQALSFLRSRYRRLSKRYGPKGAYAILGAAVLLLPLPVPGSSLIPIAVAEFYLAIKRAVSKAHDDLDDETIQREARRLVRDLYAACGATWTGKGADVWLITKDASFESKHPRTHGEFSTKPGDRGGSKAEPKSKPGAAKANNKRALPGPAEKPEQLAAKKQAKAKIKDAPVPTADRVEFNRSRINAWKKAAAEARAAGKKVPQQREYLDLRGNTKQREARRQKLFAEFGGDEQGYVVCHGTGIKMHWTADPTENPTGLPVFEEGKVFTAEQGGRYNMENLLPESFEHNRRRNAETVRPENKS